MSEDIGIRARAEEGKQREAWLVGLWLCGDDDPQPACDRNVRRHWNPRRHASHVTWTSPSGMVVGAVGDGGEGVAAGAGEE
jgi:hypothetical protein